MQSRSFNPSIKIPCPYQNSCNGCQYLHLTYSEQLDLKKNELSDLLSRKNLSTPGVEVLTAGPAYLRDRLDFSLQGGRLGLYAKDAHDIVDIDICAQLSPALQEWLAEFRTYNWPVEKGSVRLRVGPHGERGVWLDFANVDIKKILDEKSLLQRLQKTAFVEIGQRRKVPFWNGSEFKLKDPELNVWFNTWMNGDAVSLYCHVASFTQPSHKANELIGQTISSWVGRYPKARVIEFGSGIGNLTLPALASASSLVACEIDALSLEGLEKSVAMLPGSLKAHAQKLTIHRGDFQKKILKDFSEFDGILANPPRSGLMSFLNPLEELKPEQRPSFFIYMSCFPESMAVDLVKLKNYGYEMKECVILDQFPQSTHYEVLTLLERKKTQP
ncbi:class I SAM-dependent RNA methyltransferase [Bdellovibrio svalbardensis]|uniref:RNA methyltransferase n=1 Tax=Bdellovibrio svalbardensis TaxID=2972972 RepID=A0ABT6DI98_9BACT|nr:RNA methyltransferase [Bdellovibrio svalbardensis]MDG0816565.1 RNA methyltransferase [Bdellovibrio svalbardensis]